MQILGSEVNNRSLSNVNTAKDKEIQANKREKISGSEDKAENKIVDRFEKSSENDKAITYNKPKNKIDKAEFERIKNETERINKNLKDLVEKMLKKQGLTFKDIELAIAEGRELKIEIDDETRVKAQSMIDEGGELSIENVSDRLVDFAKAVSGGDKSKYDLLKGAIEEGFNQAEKAFGGELPEISHKTLERTLEKLDEWVNE